MIDEVTKELIRMGGKHKFICTVIDDDGYMRSETFYADDMGAAFKKATEYHPSDVKEIHITKLSKRDCEV